MNDGKYGVAIAKKDNTAEE
ncbi:unnamed protein product, partial [Onchocerca ochengi]|uniref:Uncharacterized protein n=1 Tax=Onchocerca ochengi TaxID=42157 RepID=A0A182EYI0_ONCOC